MLVAFGGLPGTGKTTIARGVAERCGATYLRIDTIEQALRTAGVLTDNVGPAGYMVAYGLAEANLKLGRIVVADSVNPLQITRDAWRDVARRADVDIVEVELVCSDATEHRRRLETLTIDVVGLVPPTWIDVLARSYEPWASPDRVIDTAHIGVSEAVAMLCQAIETRQTRKTSVSTAKSGSKTTPDQSM